MEDINSFKDENNKLLSRTQELEKENQSLRLQTINKSLYCPGSPGKESSIAQTPERNKRLKDKLKKCEEYVDDLETRLYEAESKVREMDGEVKGLKQSISKAILREEELLLDLEKVEDKRKLLEKVLEDREELVKKLEQEVEDYRDCGGSSGGGSHIKMEGFSGLSLCDSFASTGSPPKQNRTNNGPEGLINKIIKCS
jgi:predicted RNase H-like nuclease (RuvC/YqgF family)